jgi:ribosomal protein S18 acetylase RimI-like enzyme
MAFLGMTAEQFAQVYRATGEVRVIRADGDEVGYLWIEERDRALHVHAIILCSGARGQGIGTRVLQALQHEFSSRVDAIELGVQDENTAAIRFYERAGFQRVPVETAPGFSIMRLPL